MVAVLLAGARDGQRRPALAEAAGLVAAGLRARMRAAVVSLTGPHWDR